MTSNAKYAVFYAPDPGPLADFGAGWLGWDGLRGVASTHPDIAGLPRPISALTKAPRKYGFHGTLKPPFRLINGRTEAELDAAVAALAAAVAPIAQTGMALRHLGGFLALAPLGGTTALNTLAAKAVRDLDTFRAPMTEVEAQRRRGNGLSANHEANLTRWGYPYVMEAFRFHMTLTGNLPREEAEQVLSVLAPIVTPLIPQPFVIGTICLFGAFPDVNFRLITRYRLTG